MVSPSASSPTSILSPPITPNKEAVAGIKKKKKKIALSEYLSYENAVMALTNTSLLPFKSLLQSHQPHVIPSTEPTPTPTKQTPPPKTPWIAGKPIVFAGEARELEERLDEAAMVNAFLLQDGGCAESFKEFNPNNIRDTFRIRLQMGDFLMYGGQVPVIKENGDIVAEGDSNMYQRGVQYPFSVNEKVIIKGNRRTRRSLLEEKQ